MTVHSMKNLAILAACAAVSVFLVYYAMTLLEIREFPSITEYLIATAGICLVVAISQRSFTKKDS